MPDESSLLPEAVAALAAAFATEATLAERRPTLEDVRRYVEAHVAALLDRNPALLMHVLYRVDVAEGDVQRVFSEAPPSTVAEQLADLLIERQLQKLHTRRRYSAS